jgi:hypothetical protein
MLRGFDQQHLEQDLARLEQVQERLRQRYLQLLPQLDQVTQELQALERHRAVKQRRAELKRLRKQLLNELLAVMDAQVEITTRLTETACFLEQVKHQAIPPGDHP